MLAGQKAEPKGSAFFSFGGKNGRRESVAISWCQTRPAHILNVPSRYRLRCVGLVFLGYGPIRAERSPSRAFALTGYKNCRSEQTDVG